MPAMPRFRRQLQVLSTAKFHMNDVSNETLTPTVETAAAVDKVKTKNRFESAQPVLENLFGLYPHLFGAHFLPLKLGIYQDLMAAHPQDFKRDELKTALGVHTRSTRYLQCVASGLHRHDLLGQPVEPVAPEHVFLSIVEVFTRRQAKSREDLLPKLQAQLARAYEASGLPRADYLVRIGTPTDVISAVLDEAIAQVDLQRARRAALVKSYEASGKTVEEFADMMGMAASEVQLVLTAGQAKT
jgi:hypothetical protein